MQTEVLARREQVARRYLQGEQQAEIAASYGISQAQISKDLSAIRAEWLASAIRNFDLARAEELAKIDAVEREYWLAWERSKADAETSIQEQHDDPIVQYGKDGKPVITTKTRKRMRLERKGQVGGAQYLAGILTCIERRCAILGLDAPKRFVIKWDELTEEQMERLAKGEPPEKVLALSA
jgi:DNA-binding CsgD family transcriptional regulator